MKNCPSCGHTPSAKKSIWWGNVDHWVECSNRHCGVMTSKYPTEEEAKSAWEALVTEHVGSTNERTGRWL